jgi:radical SAM protein
MRSAPFEQAPARVYWELTRACDLACRHCRAEAVPERAPDELTTGECERVLRELATAGLPAPHVVFTGGDPLKRPDLVALVKYGVGLGLGVSVAASATPALSPATVQALKTAGVSAMSLSLDGSSPARHDSIRGVFGCFGWTVVAAQRIVSAGIPLQINTLVCAETEPDLEDTAKLVARLGATRWSLFFLVPVGRGRTLGPLSARECETTLNWIARHSAGWPFTVSTTEAPHYRRVRLQTRAAADRPSAGSRDSVAASFGIRDGNGIMFIAANGDVMPSGFLPIAAGNVRSTNATDIYRYASVFRALRVPETLHGRCGVCGFRAVCGGSRARAYAATGDVLAEDPLCAYEVLATT